MLLSNMRKEMSLETYLHHLNSDNVVTVSLNGRDLTLFSKSQIEDAQLGYSVDSDGKDLTGPGRGPWKNYWLVVGRDELVGDPVFLDTRKRSNGVLTAMHGQGAWAPISIASSIETFFKGLEFIKSLSPSQVLQTKAKRKLISRIASTTNADGLEFWATWLDGH